MIARETGAQAPCLFRLGPRDADRRFRFFNAMPEFMIAMHAGAAASDGRIAFGREEQGEIRAAKADHAC